MNIEDVKKALEDVFYKKVKPNRTTKIYTSAKGIEIFNEALEQERTNMIDKHNTEILEKNAKK